MRPQRGGGSRHSRPDACLHFHCADGFATRGLARMLHSLVRVSRRVGCGHPGTNDCDARCDRPPRRRAHRRPPLHAVKTSDATPTDRGPASRERPAPPRAKGLATLLSRSPERQSTPGYKFSTRERGDTYPRRLSGPGATDVGRLPAEVQSGRRASRGRGINRHPRDPTTSPEPDGEPLQPHSFPS